MSWVVANSSLTVLRSAAPAKRIEAAIGRRPHSRLCGVEILPPKQGDAKFNASGVISELRQYRRNHFGEVLQLDHEDRFILLLVSSL